MPIVLDRPSVNIELEHDTSMFRVNIKAEQKYDENGFQEFIEYFKNTWSYISEKDERYFMVINITTNGENDLPLSAFIKLVQTITNLHETFVKHLHSCCILSSGAKKWQDAYDFITKLYKPPDQRPLKFTEDIDEARLFLLSNKIITLK